METELKLGGTALLASAAVVFAAYGLIASRGLIRGAGAGFMGVEGIGRDAVALATMMRALAALAILQLIGFGVLASALARAGEQTLGLISFGLWVFASAVATIRTAAEGTITVWAGERWAETGSVPDFYEPLSAFAGQSFFWYSEIPWFVAAAGFGWAILRSGILPAWVGYVAIGWSALWLIYPLVFKSDLPAVLILFPILFGTAMLAFSDGVT